MKMRIDTYPGLDRTSYLSLRAISQASELVPAGVPVAEDEVLRHLRRQHGDVAPFGRGSIVQPVEPVYGAAQTREHPKKNVDILA